MFERSKAHENRDGEAFVEILHTAGEHVGAGVVTVQIDWEDKTGFFDSLKLDLEEAIGPEQEIEFKSIGGMRSDLETRAWNVFAVTHGGLFESERRREIVGTVIAYLE